MNRTSKPMATEGAVLQEDHRPHKEGQQNVVALASLATRAVALAAAHAEAAAKQAVEHDAATAAQTVAQAVLVAAEAAARVAMVAATEAKSSVEKAAELVSRSARDVASATAQAVNTAKLTTAKDVEKALAQVATVFARASQSTESAAVAAAADALAAVERAMALASQSAQEAATAAEHAVTAAKQAVEQNAAKAAMVVADAVKKASEHANMAAMGAAKLAAAEMGAVIARLDASEDMRAQAEGKIRLYVEQLERAMGATLAAKEAAESANIAKSQFLATMSHEIRTPLNVMKGMAYAMRRTGLEPQQEECLAHIDAAAAHLLSIVSNVLDLAKIEAGKVELQHVEINVRQIATDIVDMLRGNVLLKNINLRIEMQANMPPLLGDATRLRQVLLNYLSNALKFTETGTITLRVRAEQESDEHALLRFEVQDTGIGISAQTAARLFSPFEQADNSDTRQYGGTGLGLVIAKRIAELMGGSAGVDSIPGIGSTFWFTANLKKPVQRRVIETIVFNPKPDSSPEQMLRRDFSGQRILLVDDDSITRRLFRMLLEELGLVVDDAEDGTVAVAKAKSQAYAIVVMDMQMPKMGGLEATRHIRAMSGGEQVPIVMMTGNAFEHIRTECLEAGVSDFITKPVEPEDLFAVILRRLTMVGDSKLT